MIELLSQNSGCAVRSIDFNPNKQYYLCAGADDGSLAVWDSRQPGQPLRFAFQVSTSGSLAVWDSRQPSQPLRFVSTSVVDPHWFQRRSGSSILGQCGFGSGFNMGLQIARPTSQVCCSSFNQCCGFA
jgi:WD40 repeat protein